MSDFTDLDLNHASEFVRVAGMHVDEMSATRVRGHIDASAQHHTPWGMVHGGVYATAIETAASIGASIAVANQGKFAVGVDNNTDFLRPHEAGRLDVTATPIQQGRTLQLWLVEIVRADRRLVARGTVRLQNVPLDAS